MRCSIVVSAGVGLCLAILFQTNAYAIDPRDFHESTDRYHESVRDFEKLADRSGVVDVPSLRLLQQLEDLSFELERASSHDLQASRLLLQQIQQQHAQIEAALFAGARGGGLNGLEFSWRRVLGSHDVMIDQYKLALLQPIPPGIGNSGLSPPGFGPVFNAAPPVLLGYTGNLVPGVEILVTGIGSNTLAEAIGLQVGDRIVGINGIMPIDQAGIASALASRGGRVTLNVYRGPLPIQLRGNTNTFGNTAHYFGAGQRGNIVGITVLRPSYTPESFARPVSLGIQVGSYRQGASETLVIEAVDPAGRAAAYGLQKGDRIIAVNNLAVSTVPEYQAAAATVSTGVIYITIDRPSVGRETIAVR